MEGASISDRLRKLARDADGAFRRLERSRISVPLRGDTTALPPTIYFLAPDRNIPTGGLRVMYRHVDILNSRGIGAAIVHQRPGFRCTWFANTTSVVSVREATIGRRDLLVIGEKDVDVLVSRRIDVPHVVLNQSGYFGLERDISEATRHYATSGSLRAVVTVSEYSSRLLKYAFPSLEVRRVRPSIDTSIFFPPDDESPRTITYMPRRGGADAEVAIEVLRSRNGLGEWEVKPLMGLKHEAVAEELRGSRIFLAVSPREGFGLPAAEAMACGNYVVGYHGFGGREFFSPSHCGVVDTYDVHALAKELGRALAADELEPGWLRGRGLAASRYVAKAYPVSGEADDVIAAYADLVQ